MARPRGQLDRALGALTIDLQQSRARRKRMLADGYTGEYEQQIKVDLAGLAGNVWGFSDQLYSFEYPFLYAPVQRRSDFDTPHFTVGFELKDFDPTQMVLLHAHVIGWTYSEENWIIGSTVRFAVQAPNATITAVHYNATAHLAFQGYCSLPEGGEFD